MNKKQLILASEGFSKIHLPGLIQSAGRPAATAFRDFFFGGLAANEHTQRAYAHALSRFLTWAESQHLRLEQIRPADVGLYFAGHGGSASTKKQHRSEESVTRFRAYQGELKRFVAETKASIEDGTEPSELDFDALVKRAENCVTKELEYESLLKQHEHGRN